MSSRSPRFVDRSAALAVAVDPRLWWPAVTLILRAAPRGWWRRWPPLPSPSAAYAAFRVHTMLGGPTSPDGQRFPDGPTSPEGPTVHSGEASTPTGYGASQPPAERPLAAGEVVAFLEWSRRMRLLTRSGEAPR